MKLAITGADQPLGAMLCKRLTDNHDIIPIGAADDAGLDGYRRADLNLPPSAAAAIRGADMVVHTQPHDAVACAEAGAGGDAELLERISRGTYVLVQAAVAAHIGRIVLISHMDLFERYPADFVVQPDWQPRPRPEAASLAPYLAELVCREIARTGTIEAVALRFGALDGAGGTSAQDALAAVEGALSLDLTDSNYHWHVQHTLSGERIASKGGN